MDEPRIEEAEEAAELAREVEAAGPADVAGAVFLAELARHRRSVDARAGRAMDRAAEIAAEAEAAELEAGREDRAAWGATAGEHRGFGAGELVSGVFEAELDEADGFTWHKVAETARDRLDALEARVARLERIAGDVAGLEGRRDR